MRQFQLMSSTTSITATTLHPYYTYSFAISAVTVGEGPYSQPLSLQTLEDGEKDTATRVVTDLIRIPYTFQLQVVRLSHSEQWPSVPLVSD